MKIKCITNIVDPEIHNKTIVDWVNKTEIDITKDKTYVVLAISKYFDNFFYYILGKESDNYPLAFPAGLFEIIDGRISKYWHKCSGKINHLSQIKIENNDVISFNEWASKGSVFYENLLEEYSPEVTMFKQYRDLMLGE